MAEDELQDDELSPAEEGFIAGTEDEGKGAKCRHCGSILTDDCVEKEIDDEMMRFCSDHCVEKFETSH